MYFLSMSRVNNFGTARLLCGLMIHPVGYFCPAFQHPANPHLYGPCFSRYGTYILDIYRLSGTGAFQLARNGKMPSGWKVLSPWGFWSPSSCFLPSCTESVFQDNSISKKRMLILTTWIPSMGLCDSTEYWLLADLCWSHIYSTDGP